MKEDNFGNSVKDDNSPKQNICANVGNELDVGREVACLNNQTKVSPPHRTNLAKTG